MFRKENLAATSLVWFLLSLVVGYALAGFISPDKTVDKAGFLGFSTEEVPLFNWRAFLLGFSITQLGMPLVHLVRRMWVWVLVELGLIAVAFWGCMHFAPTVFTGAEEHAALFGFNAVKTYSFRTDLFLLSLVCLWGLYATVRLIIENATHSGHWLDSPAMRLGFLSVGWVATVCYFIGIHTPVFHSTKFWFFEDEVTLIQSTSAFFDSGEHFIGAVVLIFTLIFPMIKLAYMFWMILSVPSPVSLRINKILAVLGKYSMLDVFVLALLLLNLKFDSQLLDMTLKSGIVWFTVSILLNMLVTSFLVFRQAQKVP